MNYRIVESEYPVELETLVNKWIDEGFIPQGGLAVERPRVSGGLIYYQALYKNGTPKEEHRGRGRPRKIHP